MSNNEIIENKDNHSVLEQLYRTRPKQFGEWFSEAYKAFPNSETFQTWDARLNYQVVSQSYFNRSSFIVMLVLCVLAGALVRLPAILPIDYRWYHPQFIASIAISMLTAYFLCTADITKRRLGFIITASALLYIFTYFLPFDSPYSKRSSSVIVAIVSLPLVHFTLLAYAFMGDKWKTTEGRLQFIHYIGETIIYTALILVGGIILTILTAGIFSSLNHKIFDWYGSNIVPIGMICSIIVATFIYDGIIRREGRLASIIANIFAPLLLVTAAAFLMVQLTGARPRFADREALFIFNALLVVVWGTAIYSLLNKDQSQKFGLQDVINTGLIIATVIVNLIALSGALYSITDKYGLTASRAYLIGTNILIMLHLVLILKSYLQEFRGSSEKGRLNNVIAGYLPAYSIWSLFSALGTPLIFWFK
ncbi:MAG: hypothetical protein ACRBBN_06885 [Methyloligellaceae bacterium]